MKFSLSILAVSLTAILAATPSVATQPALTGYDSESTIPDTLFDETETIAPWITQSFSEKKSLHPATTESVRQKLRLKRLEASLSEQKIINQKVQFDYQTEKQRLEQRLSILTADKDNIEKERTMLVNLRNEISIVKHQHDRSQLQLAEMRMKLAALQLKADADVATNSSLKKQVEEKNDNLLALNQQLETLQQRSVELEQKVATPQHPAPQSHQQKISYANGVAFASNIVQSLRAQQNLGIEPDRPMVLAGIKDAFDKRIVLNNKEVSDLVSELDKKLNEKLQAKQIKSKQTIEQQQILGKKLVTEFRKRKGAQVLDGAYYIVTKAGKGNVLNADSVVDVLITGKLADNTVFDNSGIENRVQKVKLDSLLPSMAKIMSRLKSGSQVQMVIPADKAFGNEGVNNLIPPGATLFFDVKIK